MFHTFPQLFREQFRGKGHEVSLACSIAQPWQQIRLYQRQTNLLDWLQAGDLKRLLELYVGWQQRILPFSTFDAFLEALEKLGSSYVLKVGKCQYNADQKCLQMQQPVAGQLGIVGMLYSSQEQLCHLLCRWSCGSCGQVY